MKIAKHYLKKIIKEEIENALKEGEGFGPGGSVEDKPYDAYKHMKLWDCYKQSECDDYYREVDKEGCKERCYDEIYNAPESDTEPESSSRETSSGRKSDFDRWQSGEDESYNYMTRMEESKMKLTRSRLKQFIQEEVKGLKK